MLGAEHAPPGAPTARLLARDEEMAGLLADGVADLLAELRRPRQLRLAGLPLGDPTARRLAARLPDSVLATSRTAAVVDDLDDVGTVVRSRDPRVLEQWLPGLLARHPDPRAREFVRAAARLHAAIGQLELAVVPGGRAPRAALLTLGGRRRPPSVVGVRGRRGAPDRAGLARREPHRSGPRLAAGAPAQEPDRSTLTPGSSTVTARPGPSSSTPSAGSHPSSAGGPLGVAVIRSS